MSVNEAADIRKIESSTEVGVCPFCGETTLVHDYGVFKDGNLLRKVTCCEECRDKIIRRFR